MRAVAAFVLDHEPVLTAGAVATVVVKVLVTFGVKTDPGVVVEWVTPVLPLVFSFAARARAWSPVSRDADVQAAKIEARTAATRSYSNVTTSGVSLEPTSWSPNGGR